VKKIRQNVIRFLRKYQMDHLDVDIDATVNAFLKDMQRGLTGKKSSLDMIPTYIEVGTDVPANKRVIVADAGGTNFRVAAVHFDEHKTPVIENLRLFKMPGLEQEIGKDEFFKTVAGYLKDVADAADNIGFCFSYAVEVLPNKDGRLIRFSKEVKAPQVEGQLIGENLNRAMAAMGLGGDRHIILLNDTVVTLLAGVGYKNRTYGSYIGFILGTGTNCCYVEKNSNIKKCKNLDMAKSQIINTESGCFAGCHRGKIDIAYDKTTINPGIHKFEKMISGAYLGPVCLETLKKACDDGLFTDSVADEIGRLTVLETRDMNEFMLYPYGDNLLAKICKNGSPDDTLTLYYIADRITERAAKLTAINLSSMAVKSEQGTDPTRPICIVAEGTTFYQMKTLKSRVEFYLKQYLEGKHGIYFDIISVDNATLIGSAIAGLTN
jgi:hexokinase